MRIIRRITKLFGKQKKKRRYDRTLYYEQLLQAKASPEYFISFFQKIDTSEHVHTNQKFELKGEIPFNTTVEDVLSVWGEPAHSVKKVRTYDTDILLYRLRIGGLKAKCELHFIESKLFYFSYRFSYLTSEQRNGLREVLRYKYAQGLEHDLENGSILEDSAGNYMLIEDKVDFTAHYMSGDEVMQHLLEFDIDYKTSKSDQKEKRRRLELMYTL